MGVDPIQLEDASSDHPGQPDESEPIPAVESQTGPEGGREGDVDKNKAGQTKPSYPHPDVKAEVGGGRGERVELVSSDTPFSESAKANGV